MNLRGSMTGAPVAGISGVILAGGQSRRMGGVNKALLEVGGRPVIERVVTVLTRVFSEVILITNSPEAFGYLGLPMFADLIPGRGSFGGLYTGLSLCKAGHGFLVACDMPFLEEPVVRHIVSLAGDNDVVIPRIDSHLEPLHALYSKRCLPQIERLLAEGDLKIIHLFDRVKVREVDQSELSVFDAHCRFIVNINSPQDLRRAEELATAPRD